MKELYIAPELQVMVFAPVENIAFGANLSEGTSYGLTRAAGTGETNESGDISLIIPKN